MRQLPGESLLAVALRPVDAIFAICQALGIGIAVGALAGATGFEGSARGGMTLLMAGVGLAAGIISASADDESVILGALAGLAGAALACAVISDVVAGAGRRGADGARALGFIVALAALAVAGLSILLPPLALLPAVGLAYLARARRQRAQRKYEGLRVLR
jgi:hypothetical protein